MSGPEEPTIEMVDDDLRGASLRGVRFRGAKFRSVDLSEVRMRGVWLADADIDGDIEGLRIWGLDVMPLLDAELDRRHPERVVFHATDPADLRAGWKGLEAMWASTLDHVASMPAGTEDASVDDEWCVAETLRHLVFATDTWLGRAILGGEDHYHPLGLLFSEAKGREAQYGLDAEATPTYDQVLEARAGRQAMVTEFLATVTTAELDRDCTDPWGDQWRPNVLQCLRVIFNEEWHHHRYTVRDLATLAASSA